MGPIRAHMQIVRVSLGCWILNTFQNLSFIKQMFIPSYSKTEPSRLTSGTRFHPTTNCSTLPKAGSNRSHCWLTLVYAGTEILPLFRDPVPVFDLPHSSEYLTAVSHVSIYGCCLRSYPCVPSRRVSLCCYYTLPLDAAESSKICLLPLLKVKESQFCAPSPTFYAPALNFCDQNMIPDHYFCDASVKLAFNPEQHSATKRAFECAHSILPPSFQTAANDEKLWHNECQLTLGELGGFFRQLKGSKCFRTEAH